MVDNEKHLTDTIRRYEIFGNPPMISPDFGIVVIDRNGVKHEFRQSTHGDQYQLFADQFIKQEETKWSMEFYTDLRRMKCNDSFWTRIKKVFWVKK